MGGTRIEGAEIVAASAVPREAVRVAFNAGFEGYLVPVDLNQAQFDGMVASEQIDLGASLVAREPGGEPVGVALLASRGGECWCGGLGVAPRARRAGLGRRLMVRLLAGAAGRGLSRMRLEVIDGNEAARALYDGLGFAPLRRLDLFQGEPIAAAPSPDGVFDLADPEDVWVDFAEFHPTVPAWQRDLPSLRLASRSARPVGLCLGEWHRPQAYVLAHVGSGALRVIDSGVRPIVADPVQSLTALLVGIAQRHPSHAVVSVNVPEDDPLNRALRALGAPVTMTQTELARGLTRVL